MQQVPTLSSSVLPSLDPSVREDGGARLITSEIICDRATLANYLLSSTASSSATIRMQCTLSECKTLLGHNHTTTTTNNDSCSACSNKPTTTVCRKVELTVNKV